MSPAVPPLEAVSLDVWYTLLYQTMTERRRYDAARRRAWAGPLVEAGLSRADASRTVDELVRELKRREAQGRDLSVEQQRRWVARRTGHSIDGGRLERALNRATDAAAVRVAPGALDAMDRLRAKGLPLVLVSNVLYETPEAIRRILGRMGLTRRVEAIALSNELGVGKPSPTPIRWALHRAGVPAARALHVGDMANDVMAAWRAGAAALRYEGVRRYWPPSHPRALQGETARVPRLPVWRDLPDDLDRWYRRARRVAVGHRQARA